MRFTILNFVCIYHAIQYSFDCTVRSTLNCLKNAIINSCSLYTHWPLFFELRWPDDADIVPKSVVFLGYVDPIYIIFMVKIEKAAFILLGLFELFFIERYK